MFMKQAQGPRHGESRVRASSLPPPSQPGQTDRQCHMKHPRLASPAPGPGICWLCGHLNISSRRRKKCRQDASRSQASGKGGPGGTLCASGWACSLLASRTSARGIFSPEQLWERNAMWLKATAQKMSRMNDTGF